MTTRVSFTLPSNYVAEATHGILVGEFNNWNIEEGIFMNKMADGSLQTHLLLKPGKTYEYRYLLSDGRWVNDDNLKRVVDAYGQVTENCVIDVIEDKKNINKKMSVKKELNPSSKKNSKETKLNDFTKILGIDTKIEKLLKADGIGTYNELGKCTIKKLLLILGDTIYRNKVKYYTTWTRQAKLADAGKWDELSLFKLEIKSKN